VFLRTISKKASMFEPSSIYFNYTDFVLLKLQNSVTQRFILVTWSSRVSLWVIREGKSSLCALLCPSL